jgi:uncharacterized protein (TIGR02598 family)
MSADRRAERGFSLVEITLALGVAAVALLAVFALLPVGLETSRNAAEQTGATSVLAAIASDLRATPRTAASSALFDIAIPSSGTTSATDVYFTEHGEPSGSLASNSRYHGTVTFSPNTAGPKTALFANVAVTWPAAASALNKAGTVECFVALDRN